MTANALASSSDPRRAFDAGRGRGRRHRAASSRCDRRIGARRGAVGRRMARGPRAGRLGRQCLRPRHRRRRTAAYSRCNPPPPHRGVALGRNPRPPTAMAISTDIVSVDSTVREQLVAEFAREIPEVTMWGTDVPHGHGRTFPLRGARTQHRCKSIQVACHACGRHRRRSGRAHRSVSCRFAARSPVNAPDSPPSPTVHMSRSAAGSGVGAVARHVSRAGRPGEWRGSSDVNNVLDGVRVLEVAAWTFVPAAGAVLAEWGADVIKVEPAWAVTRSAAWSPWDWCPRPPAASTT